MRNLAAIIGFVAAVSLAAQWQVSEGLMAGASPLAVVWRMLGYFTVLGNLATAVVMAKTAWTGRITPNIAGLMVVVMVIVGLGYHFLLAGIWQPAGLAWWADQGLHTAVPILVVLWWVGYAPKSGLQLRDAVSWLLWPIIYTGYAVIRGLTSGFYPYPFIDLSVLGLAQSLTNLGLLAATFLALGLAVIGVARVIR